MADIPEEEESGEGWIVSFADLMTLLFATFVVLYGLKPEGEQESVVGVTSSIREAFLEIPDEIPEDERIGPIKTGKSVFKHFKGETLNSPWLKQYRRTRNVMNVIDDEMEQMIKLITVLSKPEKSASNQEKSSQGPMSVHRDAKGFTVRMIASHFFKPGSYRVERKALRKLKKVGQMLKDLNREIIVEGHSDSVPTKTGLNNWEISSLRATSVGRYFVNEVEFPSNAISLAGYGDSRPLADNHTEKGRQINRRVEIKVRYDE